MKISIAVSILILALGAMLGWQDRQQLATLRTIQNQLTAEAAQLGSSSEAAQVTKRERPTRATAVTLSTDEIIEMAKEMEQTSIFASSYHSACNALQLRILETLSTLDSTGLISLLTKIHADQNLNPATRSNLSYSCFTVLANDHPQAALALFTGSPEFFAEGDRGRGMVLTALACLARDNLSAALDWLQSHPQHFHEEAKGEIISAIAEQDALLAHRLITDLNFKISSYSLLQIQKSQKTWEGKSTALTGLREYLATIPNEESRDELARISLSGLASALAKEDFDFATRWISRENLTSKELGQFIGGLSISTTHPEIGRWIEWMRQSAPSNSPDSRVGHHINLWTEFDYQAAMRWALTQAPGRDRDQVLKKIHGHWPTQDPTGKEAFAKEHGIN